jgi:Zn-dependent peptidase ImmA (M78 family)/DNA-binding XRE family transcriptional regulator
MGVGDLSEAREVRRLFDGRKLRVVRELRGLSQKALADAATVSPAAVGQFEKGRSTPNARTLLALAEVLRFPIAYFRGDVADSQREVPAFFRSLRSANTRELREARAFAEIVRDFTLELEARIEMPALDIPRMPAGDGQVSRDDIETIAAKVRELWSLSPVEPIDDVVNELERHGAVVTRAQFETEKIDAFSVAFSDRPVVVLCSDKGLRDRSRFDAAHELGHLVMHEPVVVGTRTAEKQADQFAAAFLMPEVGIIRFLPDKLELSALMALKKRWGVSMASLLYRARTLGVMSEEAYIQAVKAMSARGWRTREPEPLGPPESPQLLFKAVAILRDNGVSEDDLVTLTCLPVDQVQRICTSTAPTRPKVVL